MSGIFDIGISIDRFSFDEQFLEEDMSAISISPTIVLYALKQDENIPISFAIGAGYEWQNYSNDILDNFNISMSGSFFLLAHHYLDILSKLIL